jgi:uncharacterized membrane protein YsdA (DUF1294 family)
MGTTIYTILIMVMSITTFTLYAYDKKCAKRHTWRVPEKTLLTFSLLGGAIGAFVAMHLLKHKTRHKTFRILVPVFLLIQTIILLIIN